MSRADSVLDDIYNEDAKVANVGLSHSGSFSTSYHTRELPSLVISEAYLLFDAGTSAFTIGSTLTGGTTGHTATIDNVVVTSGDWATNDAVGYVQLSSASGVFQNNETITDAATGSATASGTVLTAIVPGDYYSFQFTEQENVRSYRFRARKISGGAATDRLKYCLDSAGTGLAEVRLTSPVNDVNNSPLPFNYLYDGEFSDWVYINERPVIKPLLRVDFLPEGTGIWTVIMEVA